MTFPPPTPSSLHWPGHIMHSWSNSCRPGQRLHLERMYRSFCPLHTFLVQLLPSGAAVAFGTYVGGRNSDAAYALALDASGSAYLVGSTSSIDFPTYAPVQTYIAGTLSAFVAKIGGLSSAGITNPTLTSPSTSTVLSGGDVTFTWNAVNGAQDYWVDIGTTVGAGDISSGSTGGALFKTVDISQHLGQTIYVQLYSIASGISR